MTCIFDCPLFLANAAIGKLSETLQVIFDSRPQGHCSMYSNKIWRYKASRQLFLVLERGLISLSSNTLVSHQLEFEYICALVITILYSNQPFPSNTIGEKIFSISSSSKVAIKNFSHFFFPLCWLVYRIHISYYAF